MGLLSEVLGAAFGSGGSAASPQSSLQAAVDLIHHPSVGGVEGLASLFQNAGLGQLMQGWISNGPNPPASSSQIAQAIPTNLIAEFAGKLGMTPDQATQHLSQLLPHIVDQMTPAGTAPTAPTAAAEVFNILKSKL